MLSAADLIQIWETAQNQHAVDRALTVLVQDDPSRTRRDLASLSIGERDRRLLEIREETFGQYMSSTAQCPKCQERLEFSLTTERLKIPRVSPYKNTETFELTCEDYAFKFRLPTSWDLAAIAACSDENAASQMLLQHCLLDVRQNGTATSFNELPHSIIRQFSNAITQYDLQAEILLDLECPQCGHQWQLLFDIATFFFTEIASKAERLLWEVHALAKAYGWSEADILALSSLRRHSYLARIAL